MCLDGSSAEHEMVLDLKVNVQRQKCKVRSCKKRERKKGRAKGRLNRHEKR